MKKKFAFIGAGSLDFTRDLIRDLLTFKSFEDCEIWLMDIDEKRLKYAKDGVTRIVEYGKYPATIHATLNRREALEIKSRSLLSDGVVLTTEDINDNCNEECPAKVLCLNILGKLHNGNIQGALGVFGVIG